MTGKANNEQNTGQTVADSPYIQLNMESHSREVCTDRLWEKKMESRLKSACFFCAKKYKGAGYEKNKKK